MSWRTPQETSYNVLIFAGGDKPLEVPGVSMSEAESFVKLIKDLRKEILTDPTATAKLTSASGAITHVFPANVGIIQIQPNF